MKLWIDSHCPAPDDSYCWCSTDVTTIDIIEMREEDSNFTKDKSILFELIDISCENGAEWILYWLEATGRNYPIHIHGTNPEYITNIRHIIERNGWKEIR